jgi:hypothetical protein
MLRHSLGVVFLAACLSTLPAPAAAAPITIDFEDDGFFDLETVTQIGEVTFSNTLLVTDPANGGSLNEVDFPPHSGFNVITEFGGPMTISFLNPVDTFGAFISHAADLTINFYGVGGGLLGAVSSATPTLGSHELFATALTGISFLTFTSAIGAGSFTLDDLSFNTVDGTEPIPEPSTLLLVGTGVAALVRRRYTQRNQRA